MIKVNPLNFKSEVYITLSYDSKSWFNRRIVKYTSGNYAHAMILYRTGFFISQVMTLKKVPVLEYMKPTMRLKFYKKKDFPVEHRVNFIHQCDNDLSAPWWTRRYDFLGILGQALHVKWINNPFTKYCTEDTVDRMRMMRINVPFRKYTPKELREFCDTSDQIEYVGHWIGSESSVENN